MSGMSKRLTALSVACSAFLLVTAGAVDAGVRPASAVARTITADDQGGLHIVGGVTSNKGKCFKAVGVRVQLYNAGSGKWTDVGGGKTDGIGYYDVALPNVAGRYRSYVQRVTRGGTICSRALSNVVRHK